MNRGIVGTIGDSLVVLNFCSDTQGQQLVPQPLSVL